MPNLVGRLQREPGDDARQRERQQDDERDRLPPEEGVLRDGDRRERAQHERDRVAPRAACTESKSASRTASSWNATENQCVL